MKKNEIITLVICTIIIVGCTFAMLKVLMPQNNTKGIKQETVQAVPETIDENAYQSVGSLQDYGKPNLEGIGKTDLFN